MNSSFAVRKQFEGLQYLLVCCFLLWMRKNLSFSGMGYLGIVFIFGLLIDILFFRGTDEEFSRMLKSRLSRGQISGVLAVQRYGMLSILLMTVCACIFTGVFGYLYFVKLLRLNHIQFFSLILLPFFFMQGLRHLLSGLLIGYGRDGIVNVSKLMNAMFSVIFSILFYRTEMKAGEQVGALLGGSDYAFVYCDLGIILGFSFALLITNILLLAFYLWAKRDFPLMDGERTRVKDRFITVFLGIFYGRLSFLLNQLLLILPVLFSLVAIGKKAENGTSYAALLGSFFSGSGLCILCAICFCAFSICAITNNCSNSFTRESKKQSRILFQIGFHLAVVFGVMFCSYLVAESKVLLQLFLGSSDSVQGLFIRTGFFLLFSGIVMFLFDLLLTRGFIEYVTIASLATFVVSLVVFFLLNRSEVVDFSCFMNTALIAELFYMISLFFIAIRFLDMNIDPINSIAFPVISGIFSSICIYVLNLFFAPHLGLVFAAIAGFIGIFFIHFILLIVLHNLQEQEVRQLPFGMVLLFIGNLFHRY